MICFERIFHEDRAAETITLKQGEILYRKGDTANGVYVVIKGSIGISKQVTETETEITRYAAPGNILGINALIKKEPFLHTAIATENSVVCLISEEEFMKIIDETPALTTQILEKLSAQLDEAENKLVEMGDAITLSLVASQLLKHAETLQGEKETKAVNISFSQLAKEADITEEGIIFLFSELEKSKLIRVQKNRILILDEERLKTISKIQNKL
ncbi:MAG: Crp/Fnr family transcriptional regulator [Bacteroidota bacterium]